MPSYDASDVDFAANRGGNGWFGRGSSGIVGGGSASLPGAWPAAAAADALFAGAGVVALGVGDSVASLVGSKFGRVRFGPGGKSLIGSATAAAAVFVAMAGLFWLVATSVVATSPAATFEATLVAAVAAADSFPALAVAAAAAFTSALESTTAQIDNLFLPAHCYCMLAFVRALTSA